MPVGAAAVARMRTRWARVRWPVAVVGLVVIIGPVVVVGPVVVMAFRQTIGEQACGGGSDDGGFWLHDLYRASVLIIGGGATGSQ